jgi:hypothetical protein
MEQAGFAHVEYVGPTGVHTSNFTEGAVFRAAKSRLQHAGRDA